MGERSNTLLYAGNSHFRLASPAKGVRSPISLNEAFRIPSRESPARGVRSRTRFHPIESSSSAETPARGNRSDTRLSKRTLSFSSTAHSTRCPGRGPRSRSDFPGH